MAKLLGSNLNLNFSLISFASMVIGGVGIFWLTFNKVDFGTVYSTLLFAGISMLVIATLMIKETSSETLNRFTKVPFTTNVRADSLMYILGWLVVLLLFYIPKLITGSAFTMYQYSIPFGLSNVVAGQGLSFVSTATQNFASLEALASPFVKLFVIVFVAGSFEEMVFGFIAPLVFAMFANFFYQRSQFLQNYVNEKTFNFWGSMLLSALAFMGIHMLNNSYNTLAMFLYAGIFRLIMNLSIYKAGMTLAFTMGVHQANNFMWYLAQSGWNEVLTALLSGWGLVLVAFFIMITINAFSSPRESWSIIKSIFTNAVDGD